MPELTLKAIEKLLDLKLDEKFDEKLKPIQKTLDQHTTALADLATDVKTLLNEKAVSPERFERLDTRALGAASWRKNRHQTRALKLI